MVRCIKIKNDLLNYNIGVENIRSFLTENLRKTNILSDCDGIYVRRPAKEVNILGDIYKENIYTNMLVSGGMNSGKNLLRYIKN